MSFQSWKSRKDQLQSGRDLLNRLRRERALDREKWHEVGQALYAIDSSAMLDPWRQWSLKHQSPYVKITVHEWQSFRPRTSADRLTEMQLVSPIKRFSLSLSFLDLENEMIKVPCTAESGIEQTDAMIEIGDAIHGACLINVTRLNQAQ